MVQVAELFGTIADDLDQSARIFRDELRTDQPFVRQLCEYVEQFHGKQVRPALLLLSGQACGGVQREHHVLAAVVEMVHMATLVHDDVLDEAEVRRRAATIRRQWGNESAVLLGDFLFSHAYRLCSSLDSQFAAQVIGQTAVSVCTGEMMQISQCNNFELTEDEYLDIIERKTASLIGTCCRLGARYAGADDRTVRRMNEFGVGLGVAFQITDDLLDLIGNGAEVGKSLGRDIQKGKLTLPLIHYLSGCHARQRQEALALIRGDYPQRNRLIAQLLADSESVEYARQTAYAHVRRSLDVLSDLPPSDARDSLTALAEFIVTRRQ
jgi:octaprenyl-diphosphate synthase